MEVIYFTCDPVNQKAEYHPALIVEETGSTGSFLRWVENDEPFPFA